MQLSDIYEAKRRGASFDEFDFGEVVIRRLDLSGASARGAILRGKRPPRPLGEKSSFVDARTDLYVRQSWTRANFEGTDLTGADLTWAPLVKANLRQAILRNAVLVEADLRDANLQGADLSGADLTGALLDETNLTDAIWDAATTWPVDFSPPT